jgi:hypothetical protein
MKPLCTFFRGALAVILFSMAPLAHSQTMTTGNVTGVVTDQSGAVVPATKVTITYLDTNETRSTVTGETGQYRFPLLKPGAYSISALTASLKSDVVHFSLLVGQEQGVNLVLNVQGTGQTIEVHAGTAIIQTENANQATSYGERQVANLPVNGGDITNFAFTTPGLKLNVGGGNNNFNANGLPLNSGLYTLNGADITEPYNNNNKSGASNNTLGANEIAEAAVILNAFSAQYGRMAGMQVNFVTKAGTNNFHGDLVENYNDAILNANDFFNNSTGTPRGRSVANQYAAALGGPIIKNKTLFFVNTEGLRYALPSSGVVSVPSPQFEQYTLAHVPSASVPFYQDIFNLYNDAPGINRAIPVTDGTGLLQDGNGNLGCGHQKTFPGTFVNGSSGQQFGVNVPCALAFGTNTSSVNTESFVSGRIDHSINDKQRIYFRISDDWGMQASSTSPLSPAFNKQSYQPWIIPQINYTYIITPTMVNNFIASGNWYSVITGVPNFQAALGLVPEGITISDGGANGGGFATISPALPTGRRGQQFQVIDDLSWTRGRHTIGLGINHRDNRVTDTTIASGSEVGAYTFNDITDFAIGEVDSTNTGSKFTQSFPLLEAAHIRLHSLNLYAQDEWSVTKKVKLTYGVRFEQNGNPSCVENCFSQFNAAFLGAGYQAGSNVPYNATIVTGQGRAFPKMEGFIAEPRFGVVYAPFGSHGPVVRGGVGLFANSPAGNVAASVFGNSPNKFSPTVSFGTVGLAGDPASAVSAASQSDQVFQQGFAQGYTLSQFQKALGKVPFAVPTFYATPNDYKTIKVVEWSFEIEQPLGAHNVAALTYSGNHGYDEPETNADANGYVGTSSRYPNGFSGLPTAIPDPRFSTVTELLESGYSNYDGLTAQLRHAFSHGLQGQVAYTWSHALQLGTVYDPYNLSYGYGNTSFDTRSNLAADVVWNSPRFQQRYLQAVAGGWTVGAKLYLYSGRPFSATNSQIPGDLSSTLGGSVLADLLNPSLLGIHCTNVNARCFSSTSFAATSASAANPNVQTDFGNIEPNSFWGPGFFNISTQVTKTIPVRERASFQIGASAFNLLNHPSFAVPNGNVTSGSFGLITSTVSSPTSIYGTGQGAIVSGRVLVVLAKLNF